MEYHETQLILGIKGLHRGDLAGEEVQKWNERVENERSESMAIIVNILDKGRTVQVITLVGKMITFTDAPQGCFYKVEDICGGGHQGKASAIKDTRHCAMAFLEKKGKHALAQKLRPDYRPQGKQFYGYLPCPAVPLTASA